MDGIERGARSVAPHVALDQRFFTVGTAVAIVVVVAYSMAGGFATTSLQMRTALIASGVAYLLVATAGMAWAERSGRPATVRGMLALLTALGATTLWFSGGGALLITMPLISCAVIFLSTPWALGLVAGAGVLEAVVVCASHGPAVMAQAVAGYLASAIFVVVFSRLAVKERRARAEAQRYAAQVAQLATATERNRISREIHDSVGHCLTVVHMQIAAASALVGADSPAVRECLDRAQQVTREGLAEMRRSVSMLRSDPIEGRPFAIALGGLVEDGRAAGLAVSLDIGGAPRPLAAAVEFVLYRAAQEALTNVRRHAHASKVWLRLLYLDTKVQMHLRDDGVGAASTEGGFGMTGLRERVLSVGGTVAVRTAVGAGFALEVEVPI